MPGTRMYTMAITTTATTGANKKGIFFDTAVRSWKKGVEGKGVCVRKII